jgi:pSer/pThr/pTyr-binding forkhead associated (FHA) protein
MPQPEPTPPAPVLAARTTAKRDREAMLVAAGLQVPGMPPGLIFSLAFLTGPQASMVQVLERPQTVIGREEGDVITRDPATSRRHALIEIHRDGTVWISDLQSTNGTVVNEERITGSVQLVSQQEFTCGNSTFMLLVRNTNEFPLH